MGYFPEGTDPLISLQILTPIYMLKHTTKAGGLRLTAENRVDQFIIDEVRTTLSRCYSAPGKLWVPAIDKERVESMISLYTQKA